MRIKYKKKVFYEMERYPENCKECPCFSTTSYRCMNECGEEGHCELGYMNGKDMRDFYGRTKFKDCKIENDARVTLMKQDGGNADLEKIAKNIIKTTDLFNFFHDKLKEAIKDMHWMDKFCEVSGISKEDAEECYWKNKEIENNDKANHKLVNYIVSLGYKVSLYSFMGM